MCGPTRWAAVRANVLSSAKTIASALVIFVPALSTPSFAVTQGAVCTSSDSKCYDVTNHQVRTCRTTTCYFRDRPPTTTVVIFKVRNQKQKIEEASAFAGAKKDGVSSGGSKLLTTGSTERSAITSDHNLLGATGGSIVSGSKRMITPSTTPAHR